MPKPNGATIWADMVKALWDERYEMLGENSADWIYAKRALKSLEYDVAAFKHCITRYLGTPGLKRPTAYKMWLALAVLRIEDGEFDSEAVYG